MINFSGFLSPKKRVMISHPYQANLPKEKWDRLFCTKHSTSLLNATRSWGNLLLVLLRSLKA